MSNTTKDFDRIYLGGKNGPLAAGKFKLSEVGVGWKNQMTGQIITVSVADIVRINWVKVAREYEIRILKKGGTVLKFDGFPKESFDGLASLINQYYGKNLSQIEISTRGYNWGLAEFQGSQLTFSVHGKQAFEIPLTDVANTAVSGKSEVSIEFALPRHEKGEKVQEDSLVEARLYIPGGVTEGMIREGENEGKVLRDRVDENADAMDVDDDLENGEISTKVAVDRNGDALTAAALFAETIKQKSNREANTSELICSFTELLCVTPRGRYQVDLHADHLRLRGKTHDYKILYTSINRLIIVPRPDDLYYNFVVGIHPALRQGQTRYPYLVFQFEKDQEMETTLNLEESVLAEKYKGKLEKEYDGLAFQTVSEIISGVSGRKVLETCNSYRSAQGQHGVKCFLKAQETFLYPLEKAFLAISKPPVFFSFSEIANVTFSRVSNATSSTKTFEMKFNLVSGQEYVFSSLPREEHPPMESFCRSKKLSIFSEIEEAPQPEGRRGAQTTYADDDLQESESEDEDFVFKEVSDVEEEFDSQYTSSEDEGGEGGEKKKRRKHSSDQESGSGSGSDEEEVEPETSTASKEEKKEKKKSSKAAAEPKKKKQKKEGPKRSLTSFLYYSMEKRPEIKERNPEMGIGDISKEIGVMWKAASSSEKEKFEEMAARDKERYNRELKEFQRTGILPGGSAAASSSKDASSSKPASSASVAVAKKSSPSNKGKVKSEEYIRDSDDDDF